MTRKRSTLLHAAGKYYDYQLLKLFQEVQNSSFPHWAELVLLCSYIFKKGSKPFKSLQLQEIMVSYFYYITYCPR